MQAGGTTRRTEFHLRTLLCLTAVFVAAGTGSARAQELPPRPAADASDRTPSVLDGVFSAEQAARGKLTFRRVCAACHTSREFTGNFFLLTWRGRSVGDLFKTLRRTMPYDRPGSLRGAEYVEVIAYILERNGYPSGETELAAKQELLEQIHIQDPIPETGSGSASARGRNP